MTREDGGGLNDDLPLSDLNETICNKQLVSCELFETSFSALTMKELLVTVLAAAFLAGCATTDSGGVVQTGPNTYMVGLGGMLDHSGSGVNARLIKEGTGFCAKQGKSFQLISSKGSDASFMMYASGEIHFMCLDNKSASKAP